MSKKSTLFFLICLILLTAFAYPAYGAEQSYSYMKSVELTIGDTEAMLNNVPVTMDQAAYVKEGRTLVPFRFLAEALGATVTWDNQSKTAGLSLGDSEVKVTIGSKEALINNNPASLDVAAEITGGRTFIPLRFVSEALGASVEYDPDFELVSVFLINTYGWNELNDPNGGHIIYPDDWTVSGDTVKGLNLKSPLGTTVLVKTVDDSAKNILDQASKKYTDLGYTELVSQEKSGTDTVSSFVKGDIADIDNAEMVTIVFSELPEGNFVYELNQKFLNAEMDLDMIRQIFLSEEDYQQWKSKQK